MENVITPAAQAQEKKYVNIKEFIVYLFAVFFYTNMTGMVGSYRSAYLVNVLQLSSGEVSLFNILVNIIPFVLGFFITMYIDGRRPGKAGKFRPLAMMIAIPCGVLLVLNFWAPPGLSGTLLMVYVTTVAVLWAVATNFGDTINKVANVMTPNLGERDTVLSFRSICSAVGNSAPLVIVLVIGLIWEKEGTQYIISAALCAVVGTILMLVGAKSIKERVSYSTERKNPVIGIKDVLVNKHAWSILISEFLKNFRQIATYMGTFMAAALLGSTSKYLLFGLPTGIGTAVGMLGINFLLKKFNSKVLYIASGIYSVLINGAAFAVGYIYFKNPSPVWQIGKRLDATLPFVIGIFTMISGTIAQALAPEILYGDSIIGVIGYIQPTKAVPNPVQSFDTKVTMLFFYTVFHGIMMFLAGVPFFFYKLTGKTKEEMHQKALAMRKKYETENENETADNE